MPAQLPSTISQAERIAGCTLGTAIGDSLGLVYEGLAPDRAQRLYPFPLRHRFFAGKGMLSDDTEHTAMVAIALIESRGEPQHFQKVLAREFKWWFLALPAGVGLATARALIRLLLGYSPQRSGVFSAGNGPAMRAALLGLVATDETHLRELVRKSTRLTHTDPQAEDGARIVALASYYVKHHQELDVSQFEIFMMARIERDAAIAPLMQQMFESAQRGESSAKFAASIGLASGVTGFINHTVPVALHAWLGAPNDLERALENVIACGGDADTTAAITGALVGATCGPLSPSHPFVTQISDFPRTIDYLQKLSDALYESTGGNVQVEVPRIFWPLTVLRNLSFLVVALAHGFRRLAPPY